MKMYFNVAACTDSAERLANLLSNGTHNEHIEHNFYVLKFETEVLGEMAQMVMISGSLQFAGLTFDHPHDRDWNSIDPIELLNLQTPVIQPLQPLNQLLEAIIINCHGVIAWTTYSVDGIIDICQRFKENIELYRANASIIETGPEPYAVRELEDYHFNLPALRAFQVRDEVNFRTGRAFSRLQYRNRDIEVKYGSCYIATLGLVMQREQEIENVRSSIYVFYPLTTRELTNLCSLFYNMSSQDTLNYANELYTAGFISYPITNSNQFSEKVDLQALVREQINHPFWGCFAGQLLNLGLFPTRGGHTQDELEPIYPIKTTSAKSEQSDKWKVYDLIVFHFLACHGRNVMTYQSVTPEHLTDQFLLMQMQIHQIGTADSHREHIRSLAGNGYIRIDETRRITPTKKGKELYFFYDRYDVKLAKPEWHGHFLWLLGKVRLGERDSQEVLREWLEMNKAEYRKMEHRIDELHSMIRGN